MNAQNPTPHPVAMEVRTRDRLATRKPTHANSRAKEGLAPNPASTWTAITYSLPVTGGSAEILVRDITGRTLKQFSVTGTQGQVVLDARQLAAGPYTIEFRTGPGSMLAEKLIVQP